MKATDRSRIARAALLSIVIAAVASPGIAGEGNGRPEHRFGIGLGVIESFVDNGTVQDGCDGLYCAPASDDFSGLIVFGKAELTRRWGVLLSWRKLEESGGDAHGDLEIFGENDSFQQLGAYATYRWRARRMLRPHVKVGLAYTEFEARTLGGPGESGNDVSLSFGGGLEWGHPAFSLFAELDATDVAIEAGGVSDHLNLGDLTIGFIHRF